MFDNIRHDISVAMERDPAARSRFEAFFAYPGIHSLIFYRWAHWCWNSGFHTLGRILSHIGRVFTGIEIHPGAKIGKGVFIDHGMGVVIGETAEVGDNCTLYQGVTLGGTSLEKGKRHPTLEEGVIVGAGAKVLGPIILGRGSRVGSNAVVVKPVPENTSVVGIPAKVVQPPESRKIEDFCAYGMPTDDIPDPIARSLEGMFDMVCGLRSRIEELEKEVAELETENSLLARGKKKSRDKKLPASE
ncbi:serine O-acetyltransferase [Emcibacter sp.]|uniref:serine O-acetyltransferase n=1 Tax=Emcibacter sp. TaxID=1979954 RepID=UPI003A8E70BC